MNVKLAKKLFEVKKELKSVTKSATNPFFNSSYPDLNQHLETVIPVLDSFDLLLTQPCIVVNGQTEVHSTITDTETGESVTSSMVIRSISDPQKNVACVTYYRRATLNALLALKSVDDDGNTASGKGKKFKKKPKPESYEDLDEDF